MSCSRCTCIRSGLVLVLSDPNCAAPSHLWDEVESAEPEAFDFVTTFDAIHDQGKPLNVLKGIQRTLKADGVYLMQDIRGTSYVYDDRGHPLGPFLYAISTMHCMSVSLGLGGDGLGTCWGRDLATSMLAQEFMSIKTPTG